MKKKLLTLMVLLFFLTSLPVHADPSTDLRWTINSRISSIDEELARNYTGQDGLLRKLQFLTAKIMWLQFAEDPRDQHGTNYTETELVELRSSLYRDIKNFNSAYSVTQDDQDFKALTIPTWSSADNSWSTYERILNTTIPNYIESILSPIKSDYDSVDTEDGKTQVIRDHRDVLRYSYRVVSTMVELRDDMVMLTRGLLSVTDSQRARNLFSSSSPYNILMQRGKEIDINLGSVTTSTTVMEEGELIERLAFVKPKTNIDPTKMASTYGADLWDYTNNSTSFNLQDVYLRFLATGAVYKPFVSKVGDDDFIQSLRSLYSDEAQAEAAVALFQRIKEYKKPLFMTTDTGFETWAKYEESSNGRTTSNSEDYTSTAKYLTVQGLLEAIDSSSVFGLVVRKGQLRDNASDMNSHSYFSDNPETEELILSTGTQEGTGLIWSSPVLIFNGSSTNTEEVTGSFTAYILRHIKASMMDLDDIGGKNTPVFINSVGDIVTDDNTIILPAVANPIIYKNLDRATYYPYSVSFMYPFPDLKVTNGDASIGLFKDRYLVTDAYGEDAKVLTAMKMKSEDKVSIQSTLILPRLRTDLTESVGGITTLFEYVQLRDVVSDSFWSYLARDTSFVLKKIGQLFAKNPSYAGGDSSAVDDRKVLVYEDLLIQGNQPLFRYVSSLDKDYSVAKYIARNMYGSFVMDSKGSTIASTEYLDHDFIFRNVLLEGLNGTLYSASYTKNVVSNEDLVNDVPNFLRKVSDFMIDESLVVIGDTNGYLGMKSFYESSLIGPILSSLDTYLVLIFIVVCLIFLIKYIRDGEGFVRLIALMLITVASLLLFVKWIPLYTPSIYNFAVNNVSDKLGYDILGLKSERYDKTYSASGYNKNENMMKLNSTSLTLYKFSDKQLQEFMRDNAIPSGTANGGDIYILDSANGLYFEGNSIKLSIDVLFQNHPIQGEWSTGVHGGSYRISSQKVQSSVIDYYTPYSVIQDGLIYSLNNLTKVYNLPHNVLTYRSGIVKDSFMVNTFINSAPFLDPNNYDNPEHKFTVEQITALEHYFDNPSDLTNSYDFLNLNRILSNPSPQMESTLWYKTMKRNGLFEDEDAYWDVIESVNLLTKKFMISLGNEVYLMSDENLIKVISLYASNLFNQKISEFNYMVYPRGLNYQDFFLEDIYLSILTNSIDKYVSEDIKVSTVAMTETKFLGSILLGIDLWLAFALKWTTDALLVFSFVSFSLILLFRYITNKKVVGLLRGASIVSVSLFLIATVFYMSFGIVNNLRPFNALVTLTVIHLVCLYFMFIIITAILTNITEFGDGKFKASLDRFSRGMFSGMFDWIKQNSRRDPYGYGRHRDRYDRLYDLDYGYDERYLKEHVRSSSRRSYRGRNRRSYDYELDRSPLEAGRGFTRLSFGSKKRKVAEKTVQEVLTEDNYFKN